jgi:hypothetical protein
MRIYSAPAGPPPPPVRPARRIPSCPLQWTNKSLTPRVHAADLAAVAGGDSDPRAARWHRALVSAPRARVAARSSQQSHLGHFTSPPEGCAAPRLARGPRASRPLRHVGRRIPTSSPRSSTPVADHPPGGPGRHAAWEPSSWTLTCARWRSTRRLSLARWRAHEQAVRGRLAGAAHRPLPRPRDRRSTGPVRSQSSRFRPAHRCCFPPPSPTVSRHRR